MKNSVREILVLFRTALVVDLNHLYYAIQEKFGDGRKLLISEYTKRLEDAGHTLVHKIAYSRQKENRASQFTSLLKAKGFELHFGSPQLLVSMALRTADIINNVDCFVLGSNHQEAGRILEWVRDKGKVTKCFACRIPSNFAQYAELMEIDEGLLNATCKAEQPMGVPDSLGVDGN